MDRRADIIFDTLSVGERQGAIVVVLANEPRAYRESIAQVFSQLRPRLEVMTVEPSELEDHVLRYDPAVVVCSEAISVVRKHVPFWIELYPGYGSESVVSSEGQRSTIAEIQLSDLLSVVDRAERLAQGD